MSTYIREKVLRVPMNCEYEELHKNVNTLLNCYNAD